MLWLGRKWSNCWSSINSLRRAASFDSRKMVWAESMAALLYTEERVAKKDRLYRALDRIFEHKAALAWQLRSGFCIS